MKKIKLSSLTRPQCSWRWPQWEMLWLATPCFFLLLLALPETSHAKIIHDKERPNRSTVTRPKRSAADIARSSAHVAFDTLWRPTHIVLTNPAVNFANFYTCLIYAIYYSFFESFPKVYLNVYHFTNEQASLAFFSIAVGTALGVALYLPWAIWWSKNYAKIDLSRRAEQCLLPAVFASVLISIGLFIFGKTIRFARCRSTTDWMK